jgi:hypothetical protein
MAVINLQQKEYVNSLFYFSLGNLALIQDTIISRKVKGYILPSNAEKTKLQIQQNQLLELKKSQNILSEFVDNI